MPEIIVRQNEGQDPEVTILWDTIWNPDITTPMGGTGDWQLADPTLEPNNIGGLSTQAQMATAVLMCLFTDRRAPDYMVAENGPRGWHGDTFDIDDTLQERAMGSLLWTLERAALTQATAAQAKYFAEEALQTLIDQNLCSMISVDPEIDSADNTLSLYVQLFDGGGVPIFQNSFTILT